MQFTQNSTSILSPFKQFKSGTIIYDIICKDDFELVIKISDRTPACLKPQTAQKLIERGWGEFGIKKLKVIGTVNASSLSKLVPNNNPHPSLIPPFPQFSVIPMFSSSKPNVIKILSVGMLPNPLKVGDMPSFSVIYQNISNKPVYQDGGCGDFGYTISPSYRIEEIPVVGTACPVISKTINPNQTVTAEVGVPEDKTSGYKIMQAGSLNVKIDLFLDSGPSMEAVEVMDQLIQFSVNATQ